MHAPRSTNRKMFWCILRRLFTANPGRLFVILLALGAGAAVTAALLNLQVDAKRRLTTEFRAFGPNVLVLPKGASAPGEDTLPESIRDAVPVNAPAGRVTVISNLYLVASASAQSGKAVRSVVAGIQPRFYLKLYVPSVRPSASAPFEAPPVVEHPCVVGENVAGQLQTAQDANLILTNEDRQETCQIASVSRTGGPEDNRIEIGLRSAQRLAGLSGRISALDLLVPGTPDEIRSYIANLQRTVPDVEVRPVLQFTEAQAKIYGRISGLLNSTVAIVLVLTALCVMAAMTNVAAERKNDVGLMKAIGGATRRVLRLFLAEAALLGFAGGILGAAVGIALSIYLGKQVFGVAAEPRLIVYPLSVALTTLVAILGAFPLRRLAGVRPAAVFRGEE